MLSDLVLVLQRLSSQPVLLGELGLIVAILYGAGKGFGLPLLFWHESFGVQLIAGLAATACVAEVFFVTYLLAAWPDLADHAGMIRFFTAAGILWVVLVLVRAALLIWKMVERPAPTSMQRPPAAGLTPAIAQYDGTDMTALRTARVYPVAFLIGTAVAGAGVAGLVVLSGWLERNYLHIFGNIPLLAGREDGWRHVMAAGAFTLALLAFVTLRRVSTPALGIAMLLVLVAAIYGVFTFWARSPGAAIALALILLLVAGRPRYKIRLAALERAHADAGPARRVSYDAPLHYPPEPADPDQPCPALLRPLDRLPTGAPARPLVLVCASGGGIRAATWTAAILGRLDALPGFREATLMVTGASGGMVGATFWVSALRAARAAGGLPPAAAPGWDVLARLVARDSLTAVTRALVFNDVPLSFWPGVNRGDRGQALEDAWRGIGGAPLDMTFADLQEGERQGLWPSLVFTPMLVEDGRRLVMSNLDLRPVLRNQVFWVAHGECPAERGSSSLPALHYEELFPGALAHLPVRTAARLSAAFPYVSPAVTLPTTPRRRVVDAGYYDNYGLNLVTGWLRRVVLQDPEVRRRIDRVLVIQIRDNVSPLSVNPAASTSKGAAVDRSLDPRAEPHRRLDRLSAALWRGLEGVTTPITGLLAAREAVMLFRNDGELDALLAPGTADPFVTTTIFDFKGEASTSWMLTRQETDGICAQADASGIHEKLDDVARWLTRDARADAPRADPLRLAT